MLWITYLSTKKIHDNKWLGPLTEFIASKTDLESKFLAFLSHQFKILSFLEYTNL